MKTPLLLISMFLAAPLSAHPHIFVDTGIEVIFGPAGAPDQLRVTWMYDDFYSLLITEDLELDPDYDGVLTQAEIARLTGFDMRWVDGFNGDLEVIQGNQVVSLSGPRDYTASYADGRITTTHLRDLNGQAVRDLPLVIKPYDPTYYTAYDVTLPVTLRNAQGCAARVAMPDPNVDMQALLRQLNALDADADPEDAGLPNIGAAMSNEVIVTCPGS